MMRVEAQGSVEVPPGPADAADEEAARVLQEELDLEAEFEAANARVAAEKDGKVRRFSACPAAQQPEPCRPSPGAGRVAGR